MLFFFFLMNSSSWCFTFCVMFPLLDGDRVHNTLQKFLPHEGGFVRNLVYFIWGGCTCDSRALVNTMVWVGETAPAARFCSETAFPNCHHVLSKATEGPPLFEQDRDLVLLLLKTHMRCTHAIRIRTASLLGLILDRAVIALITEK